MFLRNYWYVAARDQEVQRKPLGRIILGEPIVLYRLEDGTTVALEDRCAHRHLPCRWENWSTIPCNAITTACATIGPGRACGCPARHDSALGAGQSSPVVERYHWLWIWMGDPALADPETITDYHWLDDPNWGGKGQYLHVEANWQLIVDDLLDLTHLAFVHETTIGNSALVDQAQVKVQRAHDNVVVTRWIVDAPAPPTFVKAGGFTSNVDRWQIINFTPPAFLRLDVGATPTGTGAPEGKRVGGIGMWNLNAIGGAYTYLDPHTGSEFSATLGFTYNFENQHTLYRNGVDMHLDVGASRFVTKELQLGWVGYAYQQLSCDTGAGNRVGCFKSRLFGVGPQIGYVAPLGTTHQAYFNLKGYKEFEAEHRPEGWNVWFTLAISPAAPPSPPPTRLVTK